MLQNTLFQKTTWRLTVLATLAVFFCATAPSWADETDDLAKDASKALRAAERAMHNGKTADAEAQLKSAGELIEKVEAANADHKQLKTLKNKHAKLLKDLERRKPKDKVLTGIKKLTQLGDNDKEQAAPQNKKLPRDAREALKDFRRAKSSTEHSLGMIKASKDTELSKPVEDYYADVDKNVEELKTILKKARDLAAEDGVTSHADLDEAQQYIDAIPQRVADLKAELAAHKQAQADEEAAKKAAAEAEAAKKLESHGQMAEDWKALATVCAEYQRTFVSQSEAKKKGVMLHAAWEEWKPRFLPACKTFRERYGKTSPEVYAAFEGVPKPEGVELDAATAANIAYDIDPEAIEKRIGEWSVRWGDEALGTSSRIALDNAEKLELKYKRAEDAVNYYKLAHLWDPTLDIKDKLAKAEAAYKEALPLWKKSLENLNWPSHNADFAGPGDPDEIAKAALAFLRENPKWTAPEYADEHTPIAAVVEGKGWDVWKRAPLTEKPTQYSVDILVAFAGKADPELCYVYHMVFYTAEAGGIKPGLPLRYANSKQYASFRMLSSKIPK